MADPVPTPPAQAKPAPKPADMATAHYAGFWIRLVAMLIDGVILGIVGNLLTGGAVTTVQDGVVSMNYSGWQTLIPIVYTIGFWIWLSATPGKYVLGLKIVEENGNKLNVKDAIIRYLGYIVSGIAIGIGFFWIGFDKKKQGWHDKIAKTYVIHRK